MIEAGRTIIYGDHKLGGKRKVKAAYSLEKTPINWNNTKNTNPNHPPGVSCSLRKCLEKGAAAAVSAPAHRPRAPCSLQPLLLIRTLISTLSQSRRAVGREVQRLRQRGLISGCWHQSCNLRGPGIENCKVKAQQYHLRGKKMLQRLGNVLSSTAERAVCVRKPVLATLTTVSCLSLTPTLRSISHFTENPPEQLFQEDLLCLQLQTTFFFPSTTYFSNFTRGY